MAIVPIPLSSAFGCLLSPIGSSSSSSRFSSNSLAFRAHRISCDCSCFEAGAIALSLESNYEFDARSMDMLSLDKGLGVRNVIMLSCHVLKNITLVIRFDSAMASSQIKDVSYRPPGTKIDLLNRISFSLPEKSFGLIFGQSGSGKTTLLQLIAGLSKPTSGSIYVQRYGDDGHPNHSPEMLQPGRVGIVFQFPERYFVADSILDEIVFAWPRQRGGLQLRELLASRLQKVMTSVGLTGISLDKDPQSLSGGYKRRLALAIQLVQTPDLLVLDEPLAGLDWKARADVVKLLKDLKKELTFLVVSHDLKELASLVDHSWRMEIGGVLRSEYLPD